jgi:hypothetical protein
MRNAGGCLGIALGIVVLVGLGCGGSAPPADDPSGAAADGPAGGEGDAAAGTKDETAAPAGDAPAGGTASGGASESDASGSQALARDLIKAGGRFVGWSATKKSFVHPQQRRSGQSTSLDVVFTDEEGRAKDVMRICQIGECEEGLTELAKEAMPKLTSRLDGEGFVAVRAIGWPQGRDELDVSALGMKLKLAGGTLQGVREGKPVRIGAVKPKLLAVFVVPDAKLLGVVTSPDGEVWQQTFSVLKVP